LGQRARCLQNREHGCLGGQQIVFSASPFDSQVSGTAWLSLQHRGGNFSRRSLASFFMRAGGTNGRLDFLKLPALAFDLAGEYFAKDLHRINAFLRLSDADHNRRV
jgi:hypothetical protein